MEMLSRLFNRQVPQVEIFPDLSQTPEELRVHLQMMVDWFLQANLKGDLPYYGIFKHIHMVYDGEENLRCLFKLFEDEEELLARKEASVYLLDHPADSHRSESPKIYGFSGVLPTIFVRYTHGSKKMMGTLIEYAETLGSIGRYIDRHLSRIISDEELHKISLLDVRFGNMDRNGDNILVREENGIPRLIPIDHEKSFFDMHEYNICSPIWLNLLKGESRLPFSQSSISYVESLDPERDIEFLKRCGWQPPETEYIECFKVCTSFLKIAVSKRFMPHHIGSMASLKCNEMEFNLENMVKSVERGDDDFSVTVINRIEERLTEYQRKQEEVEEEEKEA